MQLPLARFSALSAVALATALIAAPAWADNAACVNLQVENLVADQGVLMIAAYGDAASYNKAPAVALQMKVAGTSMLFPLCGLSGPAVAIRLYQDINGNGKLDTNLLGIPSEPWGASGKPPAMSAPTWETTNVALDGSTIVVRVAK